MNTKTQKKEWDLQCNGVVELDCLAGLISSHIYKMLHYGTDGDDEAIGFYLAEKIREVSNKIYNYAEKENNQK